MLYSPQFNTESCSLHCNTDQQGPLKHPDHIGKQGNISQLGGDFIFGTGTRIFPISGSSLRSDLMVDNDCLFAHRMEHSEDR